MKRRIVCVMGLLLCVSGATASAQDTGDAGLTISTPAAVGVIWHASDRLAIRPDFTFGLSETDGEGSFPDISSRSFTLGIGALLYTHRWDELRTYFSPRFTYSYSISDIDNSTNGTDSTLSTWGLSGSLGAQYSLGSRFGVFAEAGVLYSSQRSESSSLFGVTDRTTWTFGTRTAVGGILYF